MIELRKIGVTGDHYAFHIGKERIGNAEKVGDRWLVQGKRKAVETTKEAAKQMIDAKMTYFQCEKNRYHKLLQRVLAEKDKA